MYTQEQKWEIAWFHYTYWVPMCWIGLWVCVISLWLSFSFGSQRKFPVSVATWSVMLNAGRFLRELVKWAPYTSIHDNLVWYPGDAVCRAGFFLDMFLENGGAAANMSMAIVIYLMIYKRVEVATSWHKNGLIAFFWLYSLSWAVAAACLNGFVPRPPNCPALIGGEQYSIAVITAWGLFVIIEFFLICTVFVNTAKVLRAADSISLRKSEMRLLWLAVRFSGIILLEFFPSVINNVNYIIRLHGEHISREENTQLSIRFTVVTFVCYTLDALLVLFSNNALRFSAKRSARHIATKFGITLPTLFSSGEDSSNES